MIRKTPSNLDGERISKVLITLLEIINGTKHYDDLIICIRAKLNLNVHPKIENMTTSNMDERIKYIFSHILHKNNEDNYISLKFPMIIGVKSAKIMYRPMLAFICETNEKENLLEIEEIVIILFMFLFAAGFSKYHLRRCKNEKCNKVFYQFKTSGQHFCSPKCR